MLSLISRTELNVLTIHAEVEGIACLDMFDRFLKSVRSMGAKLIPLGQLLNGGSETETAVIEPREIPGREGWVACQASPEGGAC
jgi:undecaprenyl phosphate-alpha-L-ara4FN deformylase